MSSNLKSVLFSGLRISFMVALGYQILMIILSGEGVNSIYNIPMHVLTFITLFVQNSIIIIPIIFFVYLIFPKVFLKRNDSKIARNDSEDNTKNNLTLALDTVFLQRLVII